MSKLISLSFLFLNFINCEKVVPIVSWNEVLVLFSPLTVVNYFNPRSKYIVIITSRSVSHMKSKIIAKCKFELSKLHNLETFKCI